MNPENRTTDNGRAIEHVAKQLEIPETEITNMSDEWRVLKYQIRKPAWIITRFENEELLHRSLEENSEKETSRLPKNKIQEKEYPRRRRRSRRRGRRKKT